MKSLLPVAVALAISIPVFGPRPGFVQSWSGAGSRMAGNWGPVFHEDAGELRPRTGTGQLPGDSDPDRARLAGLSYVLPASHYPEHQCEVHAVQYIYRGPLNLRIWEERDPVSQELIAIKQYIDNYEQTRTITIKEASASFRVCTAYLDGFLHRQVGGQCSHCHDDPHQAWLDQT